MFIGLYLVVSGGHRAIQSHWAIPLAVALIMIGLFQMFAAMSTKLNLRHTASALTVCSVIFFGFTHEAVLIGLASLWAWYRTLLDDKMERKP
jgi:hypothetical protein